MANKITKKDNFKAIIEVLREQGRNELVEVMEHEIELIENKASRAKATKTQVANEGIKETIHNALANADKPMTITELISATPELAGYTNQKVSALITQMLQKNGGDIVRTQDKKTAMFSIAD